MLDIGAGRGALTRPLIAAGARVLAVEPHPKRAAELRKRFSDSAVTVLERDALTMHLPRRPYRVVASPPYAISSPLLRHLLRTRSGLVAADLVLPRAVARRFAAGDNAVARKAAGTWRLTVPMALPRRAFRPPPRIDSAVLRLRRR